MSNGCLFFFFGQYALYFQFYDTCTRLYAPRNDCKFCTPFAPVMCAINIENNYRLLTPFSRNVIYVQPFRNSKFQFPNCSSSRTHAHRRRHFVPFISKAPIVQNHSVPFRAAFFFFFCALVHRNARAKSSNKNIINEIV